LSLDSEKIRSFIAIDLPLEVKEELARLRDEMGKDDHGLVRWVKIAGIHLTLKFLGNISPEQVPEITEAIMESRKVISPFELELTGVGAFPKPERPRVIWVGIKGEVDQLMKLQLSLDLSLARLGFSREVRPFAAHLTIGRVQQGVPSTQLSKLGKLVTAAVFDSTCAFQVKSVDLMKSQLTRGGALYSCLSSLTL